MSDTKTINITRVFDAPRETVWQAWTDPEHFQKWWGPKNYTAPVAHIDLQVGGQYYAAMRSPEGQDIYSGGTYQEIVPHEKIVVTDYFTDSEGNKITPAEAGMPGDWSSDELVITITFEELPDNRTKMTLTHEGLPAAGEMASQTESGWQESLDKLAESLKS